MPKHRLRTEHRARRREELLDAAVEVIRRDGPGVSMDDLAAGAGVTKPILYRYFGDRAGLVSALTDRFAKEISGAIDESLRRQAPPRELLERTIDTFLRFVEDQPNVYRFLIQESLSANPEETLGIVRGVAERVALLLGEGLREANLDSGAAEPWAHGIVGMVHFAGDWWVDHRTMPRRRLVGYLSTLLWSGFAGLGLPENATLPADGEPVPLISRRRTR